MKNIFITGRSGAGKTTLGRKIIQDLELDARGQASLILTVNFESE